MILRARTVFPVTAPSIEDGAVLVIGDSIRAVLPWQDLRHHATGAAIDLGDVILLPGLINAHCHLDYTDMAGQLPPPKTFTDWIAAITAAKTERSFSDFAASWLLGANQLFQTGTTTVGDIEAVPDLLPDLWDATPLRVISFLEMTGIKARRQPEEVLHEAVEKIGCLTHPFNRAALSPHAPYSTLPKLLKLTAAIARKNNWRISTHVAESEQEYEMFMHGRGAMHDWLARNERDNSDCGNVSPVAHLARNNLLSANLLAIHANYLAPGDEELLARGGTHVVHCPRSHDYFRHTPFQRAKLARAGVNLCLGTDSLATTRKDGRKKPQLDLFAEMRMLANTDNTASPKEIVEMATVNGAHALGLTRKIGELTNGASADLIAIPYSGKAPRAAEAVVHHNGHVTASLIRGQWAIPPRR